ncbi:MAG: shikimate kinase [Rickettsiales bacterium]|nr:shikimate kinase [Rickettsiales bacterium]
MTKIYKPIALIGLPGSGKSTIGNKLATKLSLDLFDTDQIISEKLKLSINDIFAQKGESFFRLQETLTLKQLSTETKPFILSTGGGLITSSENLKILLENYLVIYIKCDISEIARRLIDDKTRPLIAKSPKEKLSLLFTQRKDFYNKAHITVDSSSNKSDKILTELLTKISRFNEA